jgi:hypothetical protein
MALAVNCSCCENQTSLLFAVQYYNNFENKKCEKFICPFCCEEGFRCYIEENGGLYTAKKGDKEAVPYWDELNFSKTNIRTYPKKYQPNFEE